MSIELIHSAIGKGAQLFASISGGKDGQAMVRVLRNNNISILGLIHADLGTVEWPESIVQCHLIANEYNLSLHVIKRKDNKGLLEIWKDRMNKLKGKHKPFWSNSQFRYCTSDLKTNPINKFFTSTNYPFIISAEGIRKSESKERSKKSPLSIRKSKTSTFYKGMSVADAVRYFNPKYKLVLNWYPVFNFSTDDVWATYGMNENSLLEARNIYQNMHYVPSWWPFHPAYVYGSNRVSCKFCVLGSINDLNVAARHDRIGLGKQLISMETESGFTFRNGFSLRQIFKKK